MDGYKTLREEAWEANQALASSNLVTGTFGNVSALDRKQGLFAIKPSGVPYKDMRPEDITVMDLEGNRVFGKLNPSSDAPTHMILYQHFQEIGGITHTHSSYATSWAQALKPIPILGTTHADYLPRDVPCTPVLSDEQIQGDYEIETGRQIVKTFTDLSPAEIPMVLVGAHGPFTWGAAALDSVDNSRILEMIARMALQTLQIRPDQAPLKKTLIDKHFLRKHGTNAYYGQGKSQS